jgi:hypothetical protein
MIAFPANPELNDTYTAAGRTWKWNGIVWQLQPRILTTADISDAGQALGAATLDESGKVPSAQLPSYVDDVIEAADFESLPETGETGKIYVTLDTRKIYRWSGSIYVEIAASPGTTDSVPEGTTNLYYTDARASAAAPVQSVAGKTGAVSLEIADIASLQTSLDGKQIQTVYSDTAPEHSPGLEWVDTTSLRSYRSYTGLWVEIDRA